jgi:hypothetical protein
MREFLGLSVGGRALAGDVPFSARYGEVRGQIDNDFPETGRVGLIHLVDTSIRERYIESWDVVARELQRLGRTLPQYFQSSELAETAVRNMLLQLPWMRVLDFCERLHSYLSKEVGIVDDEDRYHVSVSRGEVQAFIEREMQRLLVEENLAFEFIDGQVQRRGRRHTVEQVAKAHVVLSDVRLSSARKHYGKALRFFRDPAKPDYENSVKEAVCSVEAAAKALFPHRKAATLDDVIKSLTTSGHLPKALGQTFTGLYGYRSAGDGIGHGGSSGGRPTREIAEYSMSVSASQIILLVDLAAEEHPEAPF